MVENRILISKEDWMEEVQSIAADLNIEDLAIKTPVFNTIEEAHEYLTDMSSITPSVAVRFKSVEDDFDDSESGITINNKLEDSKSTYNNFPQTMIDRLRDQKSELKGCNYCNSRVNRNYLVPKMVVDLDNYLKNKENFDSFGLINMDNVNSIILGCPICKDQSFILSGTDMKKLESIYNKYVQLLEKKNELKSIYLAKKDPKVSVLIYS